MSKLLKWLNGKKTAIGSALWLITALFVLTTGQAVEGFNGPASWGVLLAAVFSSSGLAHKVLKALYPEEAKDDGGHQGDS